VNASGITRHLLPRVSGLRPAYAGLAVLYLVPLFVTRFLPAFDLPHHLAIVDALGKSDRSESPYARHFDVGLKFAPFVLHIVLLRALAAVMPLAMAAKALVGLVVLALPLATARLLRLADRDTMPALLALPLVYSLPLHYGLIAFVVALPALVWMLAEASHEAAWRARPGVQATCLGALALVAFSAHLEAWAIGVVGAAPAVLLAAGSPRARVYGLAALVPSILACAVYLSDVARGASVAGPSIVSALLDARARELAERGLLADIAGRVRVVPLSVFRGFTDGSDIVAAQVYFGLLVAGMLFAIAGWWSRRPRTRPRLAPTAGMALAAAGAYFGLPHHAPPDAFSVYPRFAVVLALFLLVAIPTHWLRTPGPRRNAAIALVTTLVGAYGLNVVTQYAAFGHELDDFTRVLDQSPEGLASGGLVFDTESQVMNIGGIFTGLPAYYVTERAAPGSSTWLYYCAWPQLPCGMRDVGRPPPLPFFSYPAEFDPSRALEDLELLFVRGGPPPAALFGAEAPRVRLLAASGAWRAFLRRPVP
jgi:hypothetical protein